MYNYKENIISDIHLLLEGEEGEIFTLENFDGDANSLAESLYEECWDNDIITGNGGNGCYFDITSESEKAVKDNMNILNDIARDWGEEDKIQIALEEEQWDWLDVTIRCYLLHDCVWKVVDTMVENYVEPTDVDIVSFEEDYDEGFDDLEESIKKHKRRLYN